MPLEIYSYRLLTKWRTKKAWMRFHFALDRIAIPTEFAAAQSINHTLNVATTFLSGFAQLLSNEAGITDTIVRRVSPGGGPASRVHIPAGGLQGLYPSGVTSTFVSAPITWVGFDGITTRSVNRIGFIGKGAYQGLDWWPIFRLAAETWITDALTPRITPQGDQFHLTILKANGFSVGAVNAFLGQPTSRQKSRRWIP